MKSNKLREAAKHQCCTVQIVGVCGGDPEETVLAHLPDPTTNGMGKKAHDLCACWACYWCHRVLDGVDPWPEREAPHRQWYMRRAQHRTILALVEQGVLKI